ncbi:hypothetical protein TESG_07397 [Trichophyton tonsurans CBS 112818]|uniref:Uncharacterized protein n=1 Tax=Trichophyton tonsurans (strain CBS 112818) TaxID=647933 RepID=F2S925_TRIT1|nr:hypothetical protein TESG_07397 [Trichophyton tonsurans CBS 112818]
MEGKSSPQPRTSLSRNLLVIRPNHGSVAPINAWREGSACDTKITAYLRARVLLTFEVDQLPVQARKSVRPTFRAPPDSSWNRLCVSSPPVNRRSVLLIVVQEEMPLALIWCSFACKAADSHGMGTLCLKSQTLQLYG